MVQTQFSRLLLADRLRGTQFLATTRADIETREIAAIISLQRQTVMIATGAVTMEARFPKRSDVMAHHAMCMYSAWMTKSIRENSEIFIR